MYGDLTVDFSNSPLVGNVTLQTSWLQPKLTDRLRTDTKTLISGEEVALERSGSLQIRCIDTGAGLSQVQAAAMFRDGIQFNVNELQAGQGSGLGLHISKGIAKQHGGDLEVFSEGLGRGTTFTFTLPLYYVPGNSTETTTSMLNDPTEEHVTSTEKVDSSPLRVLVVDDVATNRKLLKRLVANQGHVVDDAKDGREAVDKVKDALRERWQYDTILMDYEMPVLKGPDAAKEIRALGVDSFIIGITGNVLAEDVSHFLSCGANFVLPKPVDMNKLEELWAEHGVLKENMRFK
jgi:CheY-like chemotaxis protein